MGDESFLIGKIPKIDPCKECLVNMNCSQICFPKKVFNKHNTIITKKVLKIGRRK